MPKNGLKNTLKEIKLNETAISRLLGALVVLVIGVLIFNYFRGINEKVITSEITSEELAKEASKVKLIEEKGKIVPEGLPTEYTVEANDNLWKISERFYRSGYNWVDVAKANSLNNPNHLAVGQKITLPKAEVKITTIEQRDKLAGVATGQPISGGSYVVQEEDSLWKIALRAYGDGYRWSQIAKDNKLDNPDVIHPGNSLKIPR